jgi:phosphohistidine phosphatase SixA
MKRKLALGIVVFLAGILTNRFLELETKTASAGPPPPPASVDGDVNGDGNLNLADPVFLLRFLFQGGPPPIHAAASTPVSTVIVVRHAEKGADEHLNDTGKARALHLAEVLGQTDIGFLISSDLARTQETLAPLAALKPSIPVEPIKEAQEVVARLNALPAGSLAVVCHHSFTIHPILDGLGVENHSGINVSTVNSQFLIVLRPANQKPQLIHLMY